jgi:phage repressor protein C with HTH and peptisase S24 domain
MDKAPNRIRALREALGWSQHELAARLEPRTSQPQIDRLEKGDRRLTVDWMTRVADALGVAAENLLPRTAVFSQAPSMPPSGESPAKSTHAKVASASKLQPLTFASGALSVMAGPKDLPILGYVKAGTDGFFIVNGEVQGYAVRPDILQGVKDAYAVYVHDKSMFPAFEPGHLAWVDPLRPVKPGDAVVIQLADGQAFIKRLKRRTEKTVICEQWNPAGELRYDTAQVKSIHLVVGSMRVMV